MQNKSTEVFEKPKSLFQQKINEIMTDDPTKDLIMDIFELQMYKNAEKDDKRLIFVELYNLLGFEKFIEVMEILSGKTIKFPTRDELKELVETALAYYYRSFRGYDWTKTKELIGDKEMSSVKFGSKMQQMNRFIKYIGNRIGSRHNVPTPDFRDDSIGEVIDNGTE